MQIVKNLNRIVSIFLVIILIIPIFSFPQFALAVGGDFLWAKSMGGTSGEQGYSIATDSLGNVYTTGYFEGTVDFDPGAGTSNLVSAGVKDIFISKLDSSGNFVWAKSMGGIDNEIGYSITTDSSGNVYTTGQFAGTTDFDPGAGTSNLVSTGDNDIFISKLDSSGNFVWAKSMGGTSQDQGYSITTDSLGNVYTTGIFLGTVDFDPGAGTSNLVSDVDFGDIFISKLDSSGNFVWAKSMGGTSGEQGYSIATDSLGNVYTTGSFFDTVDFNPGAGTSNLVSIGSNDIFISKLDSSGNFVWAKSIGGTDEDSGYSITTDSSGNVYTTGHFADTVDFDPGAGTSNLISAGGNDIFISKLDSSGNFVWAKSIGGTEYESGQSIAIDSSNNIYNTGYFADTVDFDPGAGTSNLVSAGGEDLYISKLDSSGNFVWAKSMGGTSQDISYSIKTDSSGIYATGYFYETADFDPGAGTSNLISVGNGDIFVLKLQAGDSTSPTLSEVTAVGVVVNNASINYTFNTTEEGTITYGGSCTGATTEALSGNNTITFNTLSVGTYTDCTITVTDASDNVSSVLTVSPFSLVVHSGGGGGTPSTPTEPVAPTTPTTPITPPVTPETPSNPTTPTTPTIPTNGTNPIIPKIECPSDQLITQNLKVDGIDGLFHEYTRAIVREVKILQSYLNNFGFKSGKVDGIIGPITRGAIIRLQQYLNISPDGIVGPITRDLINEGCE